MAARAALVVAAHEFVDPKFQQLRSPAEDVDALAGVLRDQAVGAFEVETLVNAASGEVQRKLERFFSGRKPDDLLLLYFSCHGVKDPTGRLYFVTTNTEFDLLRSTGVSASFVSEQMEYSRSKRIVVLLDCCYSGAFLKGFRARGDDVVAVEQLEGRGRAVITASRATEYAFEADQLASENAQPSLFTGAIVEGLASGRADANGDGLVTVDELYDYVYDAVRGKVAGQTPGRWIDVEGDLVVARNPAPPVAPAALPPEVLRALDSDVAMQRLGAAYELTTWYQSADGARQKAAIPVLERLCRDYDERVKAVAVSTLAAPPGPAVGGVGPETVVVADAADRAADLAAPVRTDPTSSVVTQDTPADVGHPSLAPGAPAPLAPTPPPFPSNEASGPVAAVAAGPVPPAAGDSPTPPGRRPAAQGASGRSARTTSPLHGATEQGVPTVRAGATRLASWMAALGGLSLLLASFPTYMTKSDEDVALGNGAWHTLGAFVLFAMAGTAAVWLLRTDRPAVPALAALVALVPSAAGQILYEVSVVVRERVEGNVAGPGWYLTVGGFASWLVAGALAAAPLRRKLALTSSWAEDGASAGAPVAAAAALGIGMVAALGVAVVFEVADPITDIGPVHYLILRWAAVVLGLVLGWRSLRRHDVTGQALGVATLLLAVLMVWLQLSLSGYPGSERILYAGVALQVVGAIVVPVVAVALAPRQAAVALLATWALVTAAWLPKYLAAGLDGWVLGIAMLGAAALAVVLGRSERSTA